MLECRDGRVECPLVNICWCISVGACLLVCIRDCADTLHRYTLDALINVFVCPECPRCDTTAVLECYLTGTTVLVHDTCENSAPCSCKSFWHVCVVRFVWSLEQHSNLWP